MTRRLCDDPLRETENRGKSGIAKPPTQQIEPLLTFDEVANILKISNRSVRRLVDRKDLPVVVISDRVRRIRPPDLRTYVNRDVW